MNLLEELSVLSYRHFSLFLFNELLAATPLEASGSTFDNPIFCILDLKKRNNLVSHSRRKYLKTITGPVGIFPELYNPIGSVVTEILSSKQTSFYFVLQIYCPGISCNFYKNFADILDKSIILVNFCRHCCKMFCKSSRPSIHAREGTLDCKNCFMNMTDKHTDKAMHRLDAHMSQKYSLKIKFSPIALQTD